MSDAGVEAAQGVIGLTMVASALLAKEVHAAEILKATPMMGLKAR